MNPLNQLILEGNIVKGIEITEPKEGFKVGKFTVAVNRNYRNANGEMTVEVNYFDCEVYGEYAGNIQSKCDKGAGLRIVGRLKQDRWNDENSKSRSKVFVVVEHIDFMHSAEKKEEIL